MIPTRPGRYLLENRQGRVVYIEVKAGQGRLDRAPPGLLRSGAHLAARLGDDFVVGVVLYTGPDTLSFGERMRAMPVSALWELG